MIPHHNNAYQLNYLQGSEDNGLSLDEQLVLLEDITEERLSLQSTVSHIRHLSDNYAHQLGECDFYKTLRPACGEKISYS